MNWKAMNPRDWHDPEFTYVAGPEDNRDRSSTFALYTYREIMDDFAAASIGRPSYTWGEYMDDLYLLDEIVGNQEES